LAHLPDYLRDAATFGYLTGWRRGEIVALKWDWVNLADGSITLPDSKNGKARTIALSRDLVALVARREAERLLTRPDGEPRIADRVFHRRGVPLKCFRGAWHKALAAAGFALQVTGADGKTRTAYT